MRVFSVALVLFLAGILFNTSAQAGTNQERSPTLAESTTSPISPSPTPSPLPSTKQQDLFNGIIVFSLAIALILVAARAVASDWKKHKHIWNQRMGPANWKFSESWGSNFTVVGAILGTVLAAAGFLPTTTTALSKASYVGLNLFFGILVVVAPVIYSSFRTPVKADTSIGTKELQLQGFVTPFLLATTMTLWGVFGEMATLLYGITEVRATGAWSPFGAEVMRTTLGLVAILLLVYAWRSIGWLIEDQTDKPKHLANLNVERARIGVTESDGVDVEPELPSWSVL